MMTFTRMLLCGLAAISMSSPDPVRADIEGAYDHPQIEQVEGSSIVYFDRAAYDRVEIPLGPINRDLVIEDAEAVDGEVLTTIYALNDPNTMTLQMKRSYRMALEERGFDILYAALNRELATDRGRYFRFFTRTPH